MKNLAPILAAGMMFATATGLFAANVGMIQVNGAISPATEGYISRAVDVVNQRDDVCLIIELDTPGGLLDSTEKIINKFYGSKVPIVVYVTPAPGHAASAGTFITMAADVAAMAPHTRIGAAHPVNIGATGDVEKTDDVMKKKQENDTASLAESIADKRHRNAEWARSSVIDSVSITAEKALELHVVDLIADDLPDLLKKLDGRDVGGKPLSTLGATVVPIPMTGRETFLELFLRPEVMFILMLVVIYGIVGELSSPGAILPGVAGAIALVLVLCLSSILPINAAGLVLIALAIILFVVDVYSPTHGVLTGGGILAFFLGALMLFNRSDPAFHLSLSYIISGTVVTALFFIFVVGAGVRAQLLPIRAGRETMLGKVTAAAERIDATGGKVFVEGEWWNAVSETPVEPGQSVEIVAIDGLKLKVKPKAA
ncbi:MAG TPA: nodulation protein NfeD [Verrucomicrobiae bacterium]|jgi:membrane-bound serine protease (ClpP class)|nr:nodulation protein NfeD [Verrucomicrobiae bacterium]